MRVFIVCCPESMGNKLIGKLLRDSGCTVMGTLDDVQVDWPRIPRGRNIVWVKSNPYNTLWIDPVAMANYVKPRQPILITCERDERATVLSQLRHEHVKTAEEAVANIAKAKELIRRAASVMPSYTVNFEALVSQPQLYWGKFAARLGLSGRVKMRVYDANAKYR